jgi:NAD(P)-dependent dehydrogenase (short-subunit alcohol dehydrogenase family)
MRKSVDGLELTFAASMIGHHIMTRRLLEAGLLPDGARVVLVGSAAANNDAPAFFGFTLYDFATGTPPLKSDPWHIEHSVIDV